MKQFLARWITRAWYREPGWLKLAWPLSMLFSLLVWLRRKRYQWFAGSVYHSTATIIIIGNITAGGTGKTPLTLALAKLLMAKGKRVAIVSRGYGGRSRDYPLRVTKSMDPAECGDEALVYAARLDCPVVVDPQRVRAVKKLEAEYAPEVILSDDGLQHHALGRDMEIIIIDGQRGLGNGLMLPVGPLREAASRLMQADAVVINGKTECTLPALPHAPFKFGFTIDRLCRLDGSHSEETGSFLAAGNKRIHAVAGIGNPERFFSTLTNAGFAIITHVFPDHHRYKSSDLAFNDELPIVMTEKDAVKCRGIADERYWFLRVDARLPVELETLLLSKLEQPKRI